MLKMHLDYLKEARRSLKSGSYERRHVRDLIGNTRTQLQHVGELAYRANKLNRLT